MKKIKEILDKDLEQADKLKIFGEMGIDYETIIFELSDIKDDEDGYRWEQIVTLGVLSGAISPDEYNLGF